MRIKMKRIYEPYAEDDGYRVLVDRLWPRGMKKQDAHIDLWPKALTPSHELRKWYSHDEQDWEEFQGRYQAEIADQAELILELHSIALKQTLTLLTASKQMQYNHVEVLKKCIEHGSSETKKI